MQQFFSIIFENGYKKVKFNCIFILEKVTIYMMYKKLETKLNGEN